MESILQQDISEKEKANRIIEKAVSCGFKWDDPKGVFSKIREEILELEEALEKNDKEEILSEYGDLLWTLNTLGHYLGVKDEVALAKTNAKFAYRFDFMQKHAEKNNHTIKTAPKSLLHEGWSIAKNKEKSK